MAETDDRWAEVGRQITARIKARKWSLAEVQRRAGVSGKTLTGYMAGRPIVRPDKMRGLTDALEWPDDAIDRILAGEPPLPDRTPVGTYPTDYNSRIARMPEHVEQAINDIIDAEERRQGLR